MGAVREAAERILESNPDTRAAFEDILAVDDEQAVWTFDDIDVDPGTFGKIVQQGIVEKTDGKYRVSDRAAVRAALENETSGISVNAPSVPSLDPRNLNQLFSAESDRHGTVLFWILGLATFGLLIYTRTLHYEEVFRDDRVFLPENDPYFYRYWLDEMLAISSNPGSIEVLTSVPGSRPLTFYSNWLVATILGGDQWAADMTTVFLPVVLTVFLGIVLYVLATLVTEDPRNGLVAVFFLALTPIHATYSSLGFLEHRTHQYLWLTITVLALAWLAVDFERRLDSSSPNEAVTGHLQARGTWAAAIGLGIALTFSMFAWGGSIMMLFPLIGYIVARALFDLLFGIPSFRANLPLVGGLGVSVLLSGVLHFGLGWHELLVAFFPVLTVGGAVFIFALSDLFRTRRWPIGWYLGAQAAGALGSLSVVYLGFPGIWSRLVSRMDDLLGRPGIAETASLFSPELGGYLLTPIRQMGVDFFLGLATLGWVLLLLLRRPYRPSWVVLSAYGLVWFLLASIQIRFAAQLGIIISVFTALGLVLILSRLDVARPPTFLRENESSGQDADTDRSLSIQLPSKASGYVVILVILVVLSGVSMYTLPASTGGHFYYSDDQYAAMQTIEDYVEDTEQVDENQYILTHWNFNRMYNYYVHGDSQSYMYAQRTYLDFLGTEDPDEWYGSFDGNVSFVAVDTLPGDPAADTVYADLQGLRESGEAPSVSHFKAIYISPGTSAYSVVPGAEIVVGDYNSTITASAEVEVDGDGYTYQMELDDVDGNSVRGIVAYPGEYELMEINETVTVTKDDVYEGETVTVEASSG